MSPKVRVENTSIPVSIIQQYKKVTLSVDITKATDTTFLMAISSNIKFGSADKLDSMKNSHILKPFKALVGAYVTRGFRVTSMHTNNRFELMRNNLADLHAQLHITDRDIHVP